MGRPAARSSAAVLLLLLAAASAPPAAAVKLHVWTNVTAADFAYPEISSGSQFAVESLLQKPSLGIAFSGGGSGGQWRAASLAYGWLRALYLVRQAGRAHEHQHRPMGAASLCAAGGEQPTTPPRHPDTLTSPSPPLWAMS
jgi:hypothetical protein